jgi:hypothetical protein
LDRHRLRIRDQSASVTMCPVKSDTKPRTNRAVPRNNGEGGALLAAFGEAEPTPECGFAGSGFLPMPHPYLAVHHGKRTRVCRNCSLGGAENAGVELLH